MHDLFHNKMKEFAGDCNQGIPAFLSILYSCYQAKRIYLITSYLLLLLTFFALLIYRKRRRMNER
jgi:hypothetical protein